MATKRNKASLVTDSIAALMNALNDEILPDADDLRKEGWVSAKDYSAATNRHPSNCKAMLDNAPNVEKVKAIEDKRKTTMYRVKK